MLDILLNLCYCNNKGSDITKIILISGKAGSGKDTCSNYIVEHLNSNDYSSVVTHFGDFVKFIAKNYFSWNGEKDIYGRSLLQKIGTSDFRELNKDFWVNRVVEILNVYKDEWDFVVIPDFRFKNEYDVVNNSFGCVSTVRINRLGNFTKLTEDQQKNISETELDDFKFNYVINSSSLEETKTKTIEIMEDVLNGKH